MKLTVRDDVQRVSIWLTKEEQQDAAVQEKLQELYQEYAKKKYLVVEFHSGNGSLYECTRDLVLYNRTRLAQLEAQREKLSENPPILSGLSQMTQIQC